MRKVAIMPPTPTANPEKLVPKQESIINVVQEPNSIPCKAAEITVLRVKAQDSPTTPAIPHKAPPTAKIAKYNASIIRVILMRLLVSSKLIPERYQVV